MKKCSSILGHNYQPRYDTQPPVADFNFPKASESAILRVLDALSTKIYVYDICERCGDVIDRNALNGGKP